MGWILSHWRLGEALNPGPGSSDGALDNELVTAAVSMRSAWASWARCLRGRIDAMAGDTESHGPNLGVSNAARMALAAAMRYSEAKRRWVTQLRIDDEAAREDGQLAPADARRRAIASK